MSQQQTEVVIDDGRSRLSDLWKKEDYWAIWLGLAIFIFGYFAFVVGYAEQYKQEFAQANAVIAQDKAAPFKTIERINAEAVLKKQARNEPIGKTISKYLARPGGWSANPVDSFYKGVSAEAQQQADAAKPAAEQAKAGVASALAAAQEAQAAAKAANFENPAMNAAAEKAIADWQSAVKASSDAAAKTKTSGRNLFPVMLVSLIFFGVMFGIGNFFMGNNVLDFAKGFVFVYIICILAFMMGSQAWMKKYGIGSEAWSIFLGMLIANTIGTPKFAKPALQTEFYIKTGLVCLGAEILFSKILAIGVPGIFVAWVVTPTVLILTFIFGQKVLKMESKTLNITISADMSVCGTSAAIATAAACRAKKEELTLAIGLSLVFTSVMMIAMPAFIKAVGMPEVLGGAWIGGTVDATGAVAAAGAFLGPKALQVAATIKMIQNVLIGVTAFGVAIYFTTRVEARPDGRKVGPREIWDRFPKFVLGFLGVSIISSLISGALGPEVGNATVDRGLVGGLTSPMRTWCFGLAFTAIGLSTNFRELAVYFKGGKPLILYVCGQSFNLCLTLLMAYVMFYIVFPDITAAI